MLSVGPCGETTAATAAVARLFDGCWRRAGELSVVGSM
jgi:hypothetical protein